ncbi:hypothetical protein F4604DRAFT_1521236, partial [Suillus subluteus]
AKGVVIIINKKLLGTSGIITHELVPGRVILVIIPWLKDNPLKILAVCVPNDLTLNQHFWEQIQMKLRNLLKPDIMLGDFNVV